MENGEWNYQMYMDDIKLFAKNEKELETGSKDIGMKFGKEKCLMLLMKSGKWQKTEGIEPPNQGKIITLGEQENLQILGNTGSGHHQTSRVKRKS